MNLLTLLDRTFKAICLTIAYIAFFLMPVAAIYLEMIPAADSANSSEPAACKFSWRSMRCEPGAECLFRLGRGCLAR